MPLYPIRSKRKYDKAVQALHMLLDAGAADEGHPLANIAATLGERIGDHDDQHGDDPTGPV